MGGWHLYGGDGTGEDGPGPGWTEQLEPYYASPLRDGHHCSGRDVLIGGLGADSLTGGNGEDLLVAGTTSYDAFPPVNATALRQLRNEWGRTDLSYAARINRLTGVTAGSPVVLRTSGVARNVFKGLAVDRLTGGNDNDWFLGNAAGGGCWTCSPTESRSRRRSTYRGSANLVQVHRL